MDIVALPCIYGIMSFQSIHCVWRICINDKSNGLDKITTSWREREHILGVMYETNFMVGDLYEAVALWKFALIAMAVISARIKKQLEKTKLEVKDVVEADAQITAAEQKLLDTLHGLMGTTEQLKTAVGNLTMQGTFAFIGACFSQSLFYMSLVALVFLGFMSGDQLISDVHSAKWLFTGMGLIASSAAIMNIMSVETEFHDFLHTFRPFWKFWGTKCLVSMAFMQD